MNDAAASISSWTVTLAVDAQVLKFTDTKSHWLNRARAENSDI